MQHATLHMHAFGLWHCLYAEPLATRMKGRKKSGSDRDRLLRELIASDHEKWRGYAKLLGLGPDFADRVIAEYRGTLDKVERAVFGEAVLSDEIREALHDTIRYFVTTSGCTCGESTGVVLAGLGEADMFPSMLHHEIGAVVLDRVVATKIGEARVTPHAKACIVGFGNRTIDTLIQGADPALQRKLPDLMGQALPAGSQARSGRARRMERRTTLAARFDALIQAEIQKTYSDPFMAGVASLPRQDLAVLAEALVALTALRTRICADEKDTVSRPVDVAIVSKGEGFRWIKRKGPA